MNNKHAVCTRICCLLLKYWTKYTYVCSYIGQACVVHVNHIYERGLYQSSHFIAHTYLKDLIGIEPSK